MQCKDVFPRPCPFPPLPAVLKNPLEPPTQAGGVEVITTDEDGCAQHNCVARTWSHAVQSAATSAAAQAEPAVSEQHMLVWNPWPSPQGH